MNTDTQENTVSILTKSPRIPNNAEPSHADAGATPMLTLTRVNQEMAEALLKSSTPADIVADLEYLMHHAYTSTKDGHQSPDFRTRLAAQQLRLYYLLGRPIERQQILTANVSTDETEAALAQRIADSPSLKARLRELLKD